MSLLTSMETTFPPRHTLNQQTHTHFFHTTVSTHDILDNLLSSVNFYVTNAFVLMTTFFSTMPPNFLNTSYQDNTPSLTSFIISTKLSRSTDTNYFLTPTNSKTKIFAQSLNSVLKSVISSKALILITAF